MSDAVAVAGGTALYALRDVRRHYRLGPHLVRAVDGVDLDVAAGEFLAVQGASGSGKTTLLQLLGGLERVTAGTVVFEGEDLSTLQDAALTRLRSRAVGFVFQSFNLIPTLTAAENVEAAMAPTRTARRERRARTVEVLEQVGLADRAAHLPSRLSGGEQQRVAVARALANHPRVVLADEPTGNLDTTTADEIVGLLSDLVSAQGVTVVLVTHDARVAARAGRHVLMRDGRLVTEA